MTRWQHYHPWELLGTLYGISRRVKLCARAVREDMEWCMQIWTEQKRRAAVLHTLMDRGLRDFFQVYLNPCLVGA